MTLLVRELDVTGEIETGDFDAARFARKQQLISRALSTAWQRLDPVVEALDAGLPIPKIYVPTAAEGALVNNQLRNNLAVIMAVRNGVENPEDYSARPVDYQNPRDYDRYDIQKHDHDYEPLVALRLGEEPESFDTGVSCDYVFTAALNGAKREIYGVNYYFTQT